MIGEDMSTTKHDRRSFTKVAAAVGAALAATESVQLLEDADKALPRNLLSV